MSTPAPMKPPNRMLPNAIALVADLTIAMPGARPSAMQLTASSLKLRRTVTVPGVVAYQVPLSLTSAHLAPATSTPLTGSRLVTDTLWFWPLTIEAQPPVSRHAPARVVRIKTLCMEGPGGGTAAARTPPCRDRRRLDIGRRGAD